MNSSLSTLAAAAALSLAALTPVQAQQTPAPKSQATPPSIVIPKAAPAKVAPKTLGGKAAAGNMLTREELRACMKRLDDVNTSAKDLEQRRAALDREKDDLVKSGDALKAERADADAKLATVRDWEVRVRGVSTQIEAFNQRTKASEELTPAQRQALVPELEAERERINKARAVLADEEARVVPAYQSAVKSYNERALARDASVSSWNERNKSLNEVATKQEDDRKSWLSECANRPYREDDEIAIKAGK